MMIKIALGCCLAAAFLWGAMAWMRRRKGIRILTFVFDIVLTVMIVAAAGFGTAGYYGTVKAAVGEETLAPEGPEETEEVTVAEPEPAEAQTRAPETIPETSPQETETEKEDETDEKPAEARCLEVSTAAAEPTKAAGQSTKAATELKTSTAATTAAPTTAPETAARKTEPETEKAKETEPSVPVAPAPPAPPEGTPDAEDPTIPPRPTP